MSAPIPAGWEKCQLLCATKVMLATSDAKFDFENLGSSIRLSGGSCIRIADLDWFGITPIRKVQPIEFTIDGSVMFGSAMYTRIELSWVGKTFREVLP